MTALEIEILELQKEKLRLEIAQLSRGNRSKEVLKGFEFEWLKNTIENSFEYHNINSVDALIDFFERDVARLKGSIHQYKAVSSLKQLMGVLDKVEFRIWAEEEFERLLTQEELEAASPGV